MIKRILVALDPDEDTPVATKYAISLALRYDASLTGLAIVDTSNIYPTGIIGGLDKTHHARNLWEELSEETRKVAEKLLDRFKISVERAGVRYTAIKKE
jgi:nucleotide-binding universal stress UspA family protein